MKPKLIRILFTFCLTTLVIVGFEQLHAQDSTSDTYEGANVNEEKDREPNYSNGEPTERNIKSQSSSTVKDSVAFVPKAASTPQTRPTSGKPSPESSTKPETKQSSADDSILSFNFLYYIIQKYKLQDIVD